MVGRLGKPSAAASVKGFYEAFYKRFVVWCARAGVVSVLFPSLGPSGSRLSVGQGTDSNCRCRWALAMALVPVVSLNHTLPTSQNRRMHDGSAVLLAGASEEKVHIKFPVRGYCSLVGYIRTPCVTHGGRLERKVGRRSAPRVLNLFRPP